MGHSVPLLGSKVARGIEARWNSAMSDALVDIVRERPSVDELSILIRNNPERWVALFVAIDRALHAVNACSENELEPLSTDAKLAARFDQK